MRHTMLICGWVEDEMHNWARWCWSGEMPGPLLPGGASAECRYYITPSWGESKARPLLPNAQRAQIVQRTYECAMHPVEQQVSVAEYVRPWEFGRWQYGMAGAARRLKLSLNTYETALRHACCKVEKAFNE